MPFLKINQIQYHYQVAGDGSPLLLLHGFTGSSANWQTFVPALSQDFQTITVDLLGHGRTDSPTDHQRYQMAPAAADLIALIDRLTGQPFHLLGYSMGGRLALYTAVHYPQTIQSLILESASPGLETAVERETRREADNALAGYIEREETKSFVNYWESLPLWNSQEKLPPAIKNRLRQQRLQNNPLGLANSLRGMGTGVQPSLWSRLAHVTCPTLLLAGEIDQKFTAIGQRISNIIPQAQLQILLDVGHTTHLENPTMYQEVVKAFLQYLA